MTSPQPYNLIIKTLTKSKARFLKFIPMRKKSFVEGQRLEISFELENMSKEDFPGGMLYFYINWTSQQQVRNSFPIPPLKPNKVWPTDKFKTDALSRGFALIYINMPDIHDEQGKLHHVEFYSGRRVENYIDTRASVAAIKVKTWEEIYEFWALIVATISLAIIALEKIYPYLLEFLGWLMR